jgi:hypothetical protein
MANDATLDFLDKHPGGFDKGFLEEHFLAMLGQWRKWAGVDEDGYLVEVHTTSGEAISVAYARAAMTWAAFFTEDERLELVPYREIARVTFRERETSSPKRPIGFTVEGV